MPLNQAITNNEVAGSSTAIPSFICADTTRLYKDDNVGTTTKTQTKRTGTTSNQQHKTKRVRSATATNSNNETQSSINRVSIPASDTNTTPEPTAAVNQSSHGTTTSTENRPTIVTNNRGRGRGRAAGSRGGRGSGRSRQTGYGCYVDTMTGQQVFNPGTASQVVLTEGRGMKDATATNVDLGFKPAGLKWKGKKAMTTSQLQQLSKKKVQSKKGSTTISFRKEDQA